MNGYDIIRDVDGVFLIHDPRMGLSADIIYGFIDLFLKFGCQRNGTMVSHVSRDFFKRYLDS